MKKLLFILSALLISMLGWAATKKTLNPYAYDLKTESWDPITQKLTISFKLNAAPNIDTSIPNNERGIQIFALDPSNPNDLYCIYGVPGADIQNNSTQEYHCTITIDGMSKENEVEKRRPLPTDKKLTWAVRVQGLNRDNAGTPVVIEDNIDERPYSCHGIAVNNDQNSDNFGSIYVTEASNGIQNHATWGWLYNKGKSLLKYSPRLEFEASYQKASPFSDRNVGACLLEPHRVRVSDDGRIFVSSYNRNTKTSQIDVWEFKNGTYTPLIYHKTDYGHRLIGMDVKGSGTNVTLLLCFLKETADLENGRDTKFRLYEYNVNTKTMTHVTDYANGNSETSIKAEDGSSISVNYQRGLTNIIKEKYYFYSDGLSSVTYGANKANNNFYWGADYFYNTAYTTRLVYYKRNEIKNPSYFNKCEKGHYYGGAGMVSYIEQGTNRELIVMGRCQTGVGTDENKGRLQVYHNNNGTISATPIYSITTKSRTLINDVTIDPAYNLYAVSFTDGTTGSGTGRLIAIAMPYSGTTTTIAPKTNNNANEFRILPVPNILATDLTYAPYGNENKYEFSFNVNTKPELAQIRFYANEADMLANSGNYSFYYEFSEAERKQGRMSVIFDAVGGTVENKLLNDPNGNGLRNLPRGEYYWNVYVKTRKSCAFAPIYTQKLSDFNVDQGDYSGHSHRQHATVDNNPNNKGFGHIYVADHHNIADKNSRKHYVRAYTIGNATGNAQQDNQNNINDSTRYTTHWQVRNTTAHYTRRPAVAPDGMVYITDEGTNGGKVPEQITYGFNGAGMWVLDPNRQTDGDDVQWISPNFSTKTPNQEVVTALSFLLKGENWYIYKTNTYSEIEIHGPDDGGTGDLTSNVSWQKNGYRIYQLDKISGLLKHSGYNDAQTTTRAFGGGKSEYNCGDTNGQFSIIATKNGVWMCQHRMGSVIENDGEKNPDGKNSLMLSFFDHQGNRKYTSYEDKTLTQKTTSDFQASPGAGMAYQERNGVEYLYVVNHNGYILEFKITGGNNPQLTLTQKFPLGEGNKGKHGAVTSMNFDYAGNLVVTAGQTYGNTAYTQVGSKVQIERDHQDLVIYTMPYPNQENARAIPASEAFRLLPERVAHLDMGAAELDLIIQGHGEHGCAIDLYRPLQGGMFNTICLPFELNLGSLPADHPLKNAKLQAYTELKLETVGGEKMLELVFTDVNDNIIRANTPYIIRPENDEGINHIIRFDGPLVLTNTKGNAVQKTEAGGTYSIIYKGVIPYQYVEPEMLNGESLTMMLVADNRLALMTSGGNMLGFRGYFNLNTPLKGIKARITNSKGTTTNTTIVVDGKKVNVEKFLQEGRVYIRMGDSLYTITGEKVE